MAPVQSLTIDLGSRSYPIFIGERLLRDGGLLARYLPRGPLLVVTDENVAPLYLDPLLESLQPRTAATLAIPPGEQHKTLQAFGRVIDALVAAGVPRDGGVLALGGGVVGDIAGFAAASYQRGIAFLQAPTTLLSQVDSAVGGKTGVNHAAGKNLVGAFHQPLAVFCDVGTLHTLPDRELRAGLAEVIKYGLIADEAFLRWLEKDLDLLLRRDPAALARAIARSCEIKARIVSHDEREAGERALLNFGHTFGHAIEAATKYAQFLHGEAVALGMWMATEMSARLGWIKAADAERVRRLLQRAGLPAAATSIGAARGAELMRHDKKVLDGRVRLVLLRALGDAVVTADYDAKAYEETLVQGFGT
jgi:3-dehydroquinate synthase